ncbi:AAA family ATPase [Aeromonas salmonicida]|uniref:AAA family ATPase n=1 Tax=Aeromonas salmonicida TaxID=645 RepID=UPI003F7B54ED
MNDRKRGIRALEENSKKSNLSATLQLMKNYAEGRYVQQDDTLSEKYRKQLIDHSKDIFLYLQELQIVNFKRFTNASIKFKNRNITAFIGDNGSGKSSILEAILKSLSWLVRNIVSEKNYNGLYIDDNEITRIKNVNILGEDLKSLLNTGESFSTGSVMEAITQSSTPYSLTASISATVSLNKNNSFTIALNKSDKLHSGKITGDYAQFIVLGSIYQHLNSMISDYNLPLVIYYPVERSIDISKSDVEKKMATSDVDYRSKLAGYDGVLSGKSSFDSFIAWFKSCDDIINESYAKNESEDIKKLKSAYAVTKKTIDFMQSENEQMKKTLTSYLHDLKDKIHILSTMSGEQPDSKYLTEQIRIKKNIEYVKNAIYSFVPEFSNLRVERLPIPDMLVDKDGIGLSVTQLSQGEKSLLALVGDIARRLMMLNPSLENPLDGQGIILIDEIDLHLHPKWQQRVVPQLVKTFKNIQFIISTHSPIITSTIHHSGIIKINNGSLYPATKGSLGAESSRLLKQLYGVENRSPTSENAIMLERYRTLVYSDKWSSTEAIKLKVYLDNEFGDSEPELAMLEEYIENRSWELDFEKNNKI